jgi:hypothetical protein
LSTTAARCTASTPPRGSGLVRLPGFFGASNWAPAFAGCQSRDADLSLGTWPPRHSVLVLLSALSADCSQRLQLLWFLFTQRWLVFCRLGRLRDIPNDLTAALAVRRRSVRTGSARRHNPRLIGLQDGTVHAERAIQPTC